MFCVTPIIFGAALNSDRGPVLSPADAACEIRAAIIPVRILYRIAGVETRARPVRRSATVVPDGVLFGSSRAHQALRAMLVDDNQLEGVISLPSGVFKPYAGVSTAILIFSKGGRTDDVFFFDVQHDGYSLDDKRDKVDDNDRPAVLEAWAKWKAGDAAELSDRKAKAFTVPAQEIRDNKYDLSINRYKEIEYEEVVYEPPKVILQKLRTLEDEIRSGLDALEGMLG